MITYSVPVPYGNLGNRFMQAFAICSMAKKFGTDYMVPDWQYNNWLKNPINTGVYLQPDLIVNEASYNYTPGHFEMFENDFKTKIVGIGAWLQSEKYYDRELVREMFEFQPEFKAAMKNRYAKIYEKPVIAISIRRGDFVNNNSHYCLPVTYYILALLKEFPRWQDYNLFFFSDDIPYCKVHFECLPNAFFAEDILPIEQLCLGSMCSDFVISNSTFSWVMAYLGEKKDSKVVRPTHVFKGKLLERNGNAPDYFPDRWIPFEHEGKKIDLKDCTFTIPVFNDHRDRQQNLDLSVCMLQRDFDTNITIGEQGSSSFGYFSQWCKYTAFPEMNVFHRTRMLNEMIVQAETPIVVNYDADVFIPPMQIWLAAEAIRSGRDMAYPYDGRFARVPREEWFKPLEKSCDVGIFGNTHFKGKNGTPLPVSSVGGAVFFNKESFIDGGMENEHMISYAPEDCERYDRFGMLGYQVVRIKGALYHMDHFCGENSRASLNPYFKKNHAEIDKIRLMKKDELRAYVDNWEWVSKYTEGYYSEVAEDATKSRDAVFEILVKDYAFRSVIDVGCGIGEWGVGIEKFRVAEYKGVDFRIPKRKLLVPVENYVDYDLRSDQPFPINQKFDLAMCLEVAEHIEERFAEKIIRQLTTLSDTILFSAAIPHQGGKGHCNEQFQDYWAKLFEQQGYRPTVIEEIRWNENVAIWYRQNIILYSKYAKINGKVLPFVLPQMWMNVISTLKNA